MKDNTLEQMNELAFNIGLMRPSEVKHTCKVLPLYIVKKCRSAGIKPNKAQIKELQFRFNVLFYENDYDQRLNHAEMLYKLLIELGLKDE